VAAPSPERGWRELDVAKLRVAGRVLDLLFAVKVAF
jgi:hypothetical protein